ncbi:MAG: hypothetical protein WD355_05495 [Balneolaceae bacterium]
MPDFKSAEQRIKPFSLQKPTATDNWIFISSLAIEGLLVFYPAANNFDVLTTMSTSRDLGSAVGSLIALNIFALLNTTLPFVILGFILMFIWRKIPTLSYDAKRNH